MQLRVGGLPADDRATLGGGQGHADQAAVNGGVAGIGFGDGELGGVVALGFVGGAEVAAALLPLKSQHGSRWRSEGAGESGSAALLDLDERGRGG